jgi:hypothetical protein
MTVTETPAKFKIGGKIYKLDPNLDKLSLLDIISFDEQVADVGLHATWGQVMGWAGEISELADDARMSHPRGFLVMAATIWASRRLSGEKVSFSEIVALDLSGIEWLEAVAGPKDHLPKKTTARTRKGSRAAVASVTDAAQEPTTPSTLSQLSEPA